MWPRKTSRHIAVLSLLLAGCGGSSEGTRADNGPHNTDEDVSGMLDTSTPFTEDGHPTHYAIDGTVQTLTNEVDLVGSTLSLAFSNADGPPEIENPLCVAEHAVTDALSVPMDPEIDLYGWWQITMDESADCTEFGGPSSFALGIGAYDPLLDPAAASAGIVGNSVYGMYVQVHPDSPILVLGVAGTADNLAGQVAPITAGPLPDGSYTLQSLYLLPLDPT